MFFNEKYIHKILLLASVVAPVLLPMQTVQASDLTLTDVGNLMQRPKWLPTQHRNKWFCSRHAVYVATKKRIIVQRDKKPFLSYTNWLRGVILNQSC